MKEEAEREKMENFIYQPAFIILETRTGKSIRRGTTSKHLHSGEKKIVNVKALTDAAQILSDIFCPEEFFSRALIKKIVGREIFMVATLQKDFSIIVFTIFLPLFVLAQRNS